MRRRPGEAFDVGNAPAAIDVAKRLDFSAMPSKSISNDDDNSFASRSFSPISFSSSRQYAPPPPPPTNVPMTPLSIGKSFRSSSPPSVFDDDKFFAKPNDNNTTTTPRTASAVAATPLSSFMTMSLVDKNAPLLSPYRENSKADLMLPYHTSSNPYNDHFISYSVAGILKSSPEQEEKRPTAAHASPIKPTPTRLSFAQEEQLRDESQLINSSQQSVLEDNGGIWNEKKRDIWGPNRGEDISFASSSAAEHSLSENSETSSQQQRTRFGSKLANEAYLKLKKKRAMMSTTTSEDLFSAATAATHSEDDSDLLSSSLPSRRSGGGSRRQQQQQQQQEYYSRRNNTRRPSSKLRYERVRENYEENEEDEEDDFYGDLYKSRRSNKKASPRGNDTRSLYREEDDDEAQLRLLRRRNRGEFELSDDNDEYLDDDDHLAWSRTRRFASVDENDDEHPRRNRNDGLLLGIHRRRFQGEEEEDEDELLRIQRVRPKKQSVGFDLDRFRYAPKLRKDTQVAPSISTPPVKVAVEKDNDDGDDDDYLLDLARNVMDRPMHTLEAMMQAISSRLPPAAAQLL